MHFGKKYAIIKHNNACGIASSSDVLASYQLALEADPLSAFGGVLVTNKKIDYKSSLEINKLFFEILIAPEKRYRLLAEMKKQLFIELTGRGYGLTQRGKWYVEKHAKKKHIKH